MAIAYPIIPGVTFKAVPGYPDYCVGDDGSLWGSRRSRVWRRHKPKSRCKAGHVRGHLRGDRKESHPFMQRLILEIFVGPCPPGMEACHNDGDPTNNRVDNLRWDTHRANIKDRESHGRTAKGSAVASSKLTEADIPVIRRLVRTGASRRSVARAYGLKTGTVCKIMDKETWRHVPDPDPVVS